MKASEFLDKLSNINFSKLEEKKGLGPVLIENLQDFIASKRFSRLLKGFRELEEQNQGIELISKKNEHITNQDGDMITFAITGAFDRPRDEIRTRLENLGLKFCSSVSKNTKYLLAGNKAGSTLEKSKKLGIKIFENVNDLLDDIGIKDIESTVENDNSELLF